MGVGVTCVDVLESKIDNLKKGIIPIYEPELEDMVFDENGDADLKYVLEVARTIGRYMNKYLLIVTKSTVPLGTAQKVKSVIRKELTKRNVLFDFDVASNPEFLKEGDAIADFMKPDRVVVGVGSDKAREIMERLYKPL